MKLKLPIKRSGPKRSRAPTTPRGSPITQLQLKALRRYALPKGAVLNPYGHYGNSQRSRYRQTFFGLQLKPAYRPQAMQRKRLKLKEQKARALEAHELQQIARENATLAMKTLVEISKSKRAPEATRIAASSVILDRAYGKASQTSITAGVTSGKANEIGPEELDKRIERALKRVEDLTSRKAKPPASKNRPADLRKLN